jgi:hypothetical protein
VREELDMSQTPAAITVDDDIDWLTEQVEALRELGRQEQVSDGEKYDFSIRWGTALAGRLPRLLHYSSRGLLDLADEERFQALCDDLRELSDLVAKLGLVQPVFSAAPRAATRRRQEPRPATSRRGPLFGRG